MSLYFYCIYSVGAVDCIDVLLRKGANPNKQDMLEVHALYHAARNGWVSNDFCAEPILSYSCVSNIQNFKCIVCKAHWDELPHAVLSVKVICVCVWGGGGGWRGGRKHMGNVIVINYVNWTS